MIFFHWTLYKCLCSFSSALIEFIFISAQSRGITVAINQRDSPSAGYAAPNAANYQSDFNGKINTKTNWK